MMRLILPLIILTAFTTQAQIVNTQYGPIQGAQNGAVLQFLGVPFAKPPVGSLRWKAPENPDVWNTTLNTTAFAPACPQKAFQQGDTTYTLEGDEDCLYLNIWTPQTGPGNKAVMVFIHGGGNQQGSANEVNGGTQMYFGKNMATRGDVVVVTIQYRLGSLGYLVHPGLEEENTNSLAGNYAVMDQILALNWIKNNIANFGGNPDNVTIFGESAGGVNVGNLLTTPMAAGLFQRACIQSATPVINDYDDSKTKGVNFVNSYALATGSNTNKIAYLRSLPPDSLTIKDQSPLAGGAVQMNWQPVLDNYIFTGYASTVFQSGNFNRVPLMIGSNSEEMSLSAPPTVVPAMVTALVNASVPQAFRPQALSLYPPGNNNTQAKESYIGILTDVQFTNTTRRTAECVSKNQEEPVWRYFFTHKHTIQALQPLGSYHGMELFYVFNNWENATLGQGILFKPADDSVQNVMLSYWTNFAKTGNPNNGILPQWPEYDAATDCYLEIKATPNGTQCGVRTAKCNFWDDMSAYQGCTVLSTNDASATSTYSIYPNPAGNNVTINWQATGNQTASLRVIDVSGKLITSVNNIIPGYILSTQDIATGLYILQLQLAQGLVTKKLIIQH